MVHHCQGHPWRVGLQAVLPVRQRWARERFSLVQELDVVAEAADSTQSEGSRMLSRVCRGHFGCWTIAVGEPELGRSDQSARQARQFGPRAAQLLRRSVALRNICKKSSIVRSVFRNWDNSYPAPIFPKPNQRPLIPILIQKRQAHTLQVHTHESAWSKGTNAVRRLCGAIGPVRRWIDSLSCLGQDRGPELAKPSTSFVYVVSGKPEIETTVESPRSAALSSEGSIP